MDGFIDDAEEDDRRLILKTPRLVLRRPGERDVPSVMRLINNPRIAENLASVPHPFLREDAHRWLDPGATSKQSARFVILHGGDVIGAAGFGKLEPDAAYPDVGYWIGEPFWGFGYATEAIQAVIDHAFATTSFRQLLGGCRVTNRHSRRVLQKCGFQYFGDDMIQSRYFGSAVAVHRFRLERTIWTSLKAWGAAG